MSEKANMAVKLEPELRDRLQALGVSKKRSAHWLMCEAIKRYVESEEEVERAKSEALERLTRFEATGEYVAHEDVDAWLKSWGSKRERPAPKRSRTWPT
ncbi:MAG TPA: hypothetical protein VMK42_01950 [Anaeromyxobacteraceae bacterium]|nr:hypothetical protein [Anaeromyxobacteraceae bacterium]